MSPNTYLIPGKLGSQQSPRMRPTRPIQRKNPIPKQRVKLLMSRPKTEILELRRQDSFHILRLNRRQQLARQKPLSKRRAMDIELIAQIVDPPLFADGLA